MSTRDNYSGQKVVSALEAAVITGDTNGITVDLQGFESCLLIANVGAADATLDGSNKIELEVEEAADDGTGSPDTWADVADADLLQWVAGTNDGTFALIDADSEDSQLYITGYRGSKRFVRLVVNETGTVSIELAAEAVLGHAHQEPVNAIT